jgi:hypothetical protein
MRIFLILASRSILESFTSLQENDARSLFECCFPLCLSQACLGKTIISSIKWRKRDAFSHVPERFECAEVGRCPILQQNGLFLSAAFPMFVPSLPW